MKNATKKKAMFIVGFIVPHRLTANIYLRPLRQKKKKKKQVKKPTMFYTSLKVHRKRR